MKILVNDKQVQLYSYEEDIALLERYALLIPNSLPAYYRIIEKTKTDWKIEDIRERLDLPLDEIRSILPKLLTLYPSLDSRTIILLWILGHEIPPIENLTALDPGLSSTDKVKRLLRDYEEYVTKERESIKEKLARRKNIFQELDKFDSVEQEPFILEKTTLTLTITLPNGESLLDTFDALESNKDIPFILLYIEGKSYYKIYRHIPPPAIWIDFVPPKDGLYFKVLHDKDSKIRSKMSLNKLYSDAVWYPNNILSLELSITGTVTVDQITAKILNSFGNRMTIDVLDTKQSFVRGFYDIRGFSLNRAIFTDMIMNDDIVSYFFFTDERRKSALKKHSYTIYYLPGEKVVSKAMSIALNIVAVGDDVTIEVRVSRAKNEDAVEKFRALFSKILGLYDIRKNNVIAEYEEVIPKFMKIANVFIKKTEIKETKKTGKRAIRLRQLRPDIFISQYPDKCQQDSQPYIVALEDKDKVLKQLKNDEHKIMEYEGDIYACAPREKTDSDGRHRWPGLQPNKLANKSRFPYLPCCFKIDQYQRKTSALNKYLSSEEGVVEEDKKKDKRSYILAQTTFAKPGQFIFPPLYVRKTIELCDFPKVKWGDRTILPILRLGVDLGPDSFLRCFLTAFDEEFRNTDEDMVKRFTVVQLREVLSKRDFSICKQELYDYTSDEISSYLLDENSYVDSLLFVTLLSTHFNCNTIVISVDENANCQIEIPRHSQAYLMKDYDENKPMVIIMKYAKKDKIIPYVYELLVNATIANGKFISDIDYVFTHPALISLLICAMYETNDVHIISYDSAAKEYTHPPQNC